MKKRVVAIPADTWACGKYRIIDPFTKLASEDHGDIEFDVIPFNNRPNLEQIEKTIDGFDAVVFQRVADERVLDLMKRVKEKGKKVYLEIDDNLKCVARTSPAWTVWGTDKPYLGNFLKALPLADTVFVSTPELTDTYSDYADVFKVFKNAIDADLPIFAPEFSRRAEMPLDKTVVLWTGSSTHIDSLKVIGEHIRPAFNNRLNSIFALCSNPEFLKLFTIKSAQKQYIPHVPIERYFNIPSMGDIGLAPVAINDFNLAKSELKCLEYGIWGVPVICTGIAPYTRFNEVSGGANIIVENNNLRDWNKAIGDLIDNPELRKELGQKAKETVLKHYNLRDVNKERLEFFRAEFSK